RPVDQWNKGKKSEFKERVEYVVGGAQGEGGGRVEEGAKQADERRDGIHPVRMEQAAQTCPL
ncbi:hypothetical protein HYV73_00070, partial [Candidatus Uhrbacteria bacterium]|nr:hypothetical protein [Candidatus Uhrbacteria bacterium]